MVRLCLDEVIEVEGIVRLLVHVGEQKGVSVFLCKISSRGRGGGLQVWATPPWGQVMFFTVVKVN